MARKRSWLISIGEAFSGMGGPVKELREASPQARHHFTQNQLVSAREADADLGFMARLMALCSLPRTNPGNRLRYVRRNGPYKLGMTAGIDTKLPYGNIPRLLLAWVSTEAVRTQSRNIVLGSSLAEFMGKLGLHTSGGSSRGDRMRLRNQMNRLFHCQVELIHEDESGKQSVGSRIADRTEGVLAGDLDLSHLSPALYGHLNPYGKYRFDLDEDLHGAALRPLRTPGDDP